MIKIIDRDTVVFAAPAATDERRYICSKCGQRVKVKNDRIDRHYTPGDARYCDSSGMDAWGLKKAPRQVD